MADVYLTVDLGGTRIRAARCRADGTIEARQEQFTRVAKGPDAVITHIESLLRNVWPDRDHVNAIGLVAPGPLDPWTGVIYTAPNLPGFNDVPIRDRLIDTFHVPVFVGNDANLAGLAEWRFGSGRGHSDLVYLTISTGIGGGVIIDNRLLLGSKGLAAELGHITLDHSNGICNCGNVGCLEWLASGTGIVRQAVRRLQAGETSMLHEMSQRRPDTIDVEMINQAAGRGDALANSVLDEAFHVLGLGVVTFLHIFNPSIVIIGGGVSNLGDRLFTPVRTIVEQHVMNERYLCPIVPAQLSRDVGLLGALALTLDPPPQRERESAH
jgi:glucokinase